MLSRFDGDDGRRRLIDLLRSQSLISGDTVIAAEIATASSLCEIAAGDVLIRQEAADNDLYLILAGGMRIIVNGRDVALRRPGQHVGEMAILDPSAPRTATVVAAEPSIVAKVSEANFVRLAEAHSYLWRALALQLCRRLNERKRFHPEPNVKPVIFVGSANEQVSIAEAMAASIPSHMADAILWSKGVFEPSNFVMDDLDAQLRGADFAVLVAGGDDQVISRGVQSDAPRDNVVFELGLFMGALSRFRTFLAVPKDSKIKIPTDLLGLTCIFYDAVATDPAAAVKTAVDELVEAIAKKGPK
jgi:predicted nucleotide-binding protein